jgi:hypothetical protein
MIGLRTEILAFGVPPKVLLKKSRSLWLLLLGFGLVLGAPVLIDQATIRPLEETRNGFLAPVIEVWKPVVFPTAWQVAGQDGVAGAAAPSTATRGAAPAWPVSSAAASSAANTATAIATASVYRRAKP